MTDETKKSSPASDTQCDFSAGTPADPDAAETGGSDAQAFQAILTLVSRESGVDMRCYKESTLRRQTLRRCRALGLAGLDAYLAHLCVSPDELDRLQQSFMISVSSFFRDPEVFSELARALQTVVDGKQAGDALRVWVPACATGEEVYSITIVLAEIIGERFGQLDIRVFATDIDEDALDVARAGLYPTSDVSGLSPERLARWFTAEGDGWRVVKPLREMCVFSVHDLVGHPPLVRMDLVSCRNILIYFKPGRQAELLRSFHFALKPGGLLLLGKSESVGLDGDGFESLDASGKLYRSSALPVARPHVTHLAVPARPVVPRQASAVRRDSLVEVSRKVLLDAYGPPAVLIDASFEPLHFFGASRRYFTLPAGSADFSVFGLCLPELRSELRALCFRMRQEQLTELQGLGTLVRLGDEILKVRPVVRRVESGGTDPQWALLVGFEETPSTPATRAAGDVEVLPPGEAADEIGRLRQELADTRDHLQAVIEQLEASNEELQCLNEELQSAGEELQASNEELQATNEELTTLNDELQVKSVEYARLNATLGNIQNSIRTSLIVVDRDGRVTRFNPLASRIFGLLPNDIGQFLYGVPCYLDLPRLREWVEGVVARNESTVEHVHQRGFHYLMQIDAYRDENGRNAGAVLTFTDISDLHRAEEAQARSEARFRQVWDTSVDGLAVVSGDGH
ncbi:MAG: PAS domain-containing protein, partial [Zoogloea sp.]|nr:PAS domain-containing protein [Zoogloea sp.]